MLGIKPRALVMLSKHSTKWEILHPISVFWLQKTKSKVPLTGWSSLESKHQLANTSDLVSVANRFTDISKSNSLRDPRSRRGTLSYLEMTKPREEIWLWCQSGIHRMLTLGNRRKNQAGLGGQHQPSCLVVDFVSGTGSWLAWSSLWNQGWPWTFDFPASTFWIYKHMEPCWVYAALEVQSRASGMEGKAHCWLSYLSSTVTRLLKSKTLHSGAGDVAQWLKCLLCKIKDQSSDAQNAARRKWVGGVATCRSVLKKQR